MRSDKEEPSDVSYFEDSESVSDRIYCGDIMMDRQHGCSIPKQQTAVEDEDGTTMDHETNDDKKPTTTGCSIPKQQTAVEDEDGTTMDYEMNDDKKSTTTGCSIPKQQTAVEDEDGTTMDHETNDDKKPTTTRRNSSKNINSKKSVTTEGYTKGFLDYMFHPIYQVHKMISGDEDEQPPKETTFDDDEDQDKSNANIVNQHFCDMSSMTYTHAYNNNNNAGNVDRNSSSNNNNNNDNNSRRGIFVCESRKGKLFVVCLLLIPIIILLTGVIATVVIANQNRYDLTSDSTYQSGNTQNQQNQKADDAANAELCEEQKVEQVKNVKVLLRLNGVEDYIDPLEREHISDALIEAYNNVSLGPCGGDKYKRWMVSASIWAQLIGGSQRQSLFEIDAYISYFNCPNEEIFASDYTGHSMPEIDDPTGGVSFSIDGEDGENGENDIVDEEMDTEQEDGEDAVGGGEEEEMDIEHSFSLDGEQEDGEDAVGDSDEEEINVESAFSLDENQGQDAVGGGGGGRKLPVATTSNFRGYNGGDNKRVDLPSKSIFERRFENVNDKKHVTTSTTNRELKYDSDDSTVVSSTLKASDIIIAMEAIIFQKYEDGHISGVFTGISEASVQNSNGTAYQPIPLV